MTPRSEVYAAIDGERDYQQSRAREVTPDEIDHAHSLEEWFTYMADYVREAQHLLSRTWTPDGKVPEALNIMRKVTAMGVSAMEQHGAPRR